MNFDKIKEIYYNEVYHENITLEEITNFAFSCFNSYEDCIEFLEEQDASLTEAIKAYELLLNVEIPTISSLDLAVALLVQRLMIRKIAQDKLKETRKEKKYEDKN